MTAGELKDTRAFNTRSLTLMEEARRKDCKGVGAPNVTFGSNRSVKNGVKERGRMKVRVSLIVAVGEISIDPPRGSEIPK